MERQLLMVRDVSEVPYDKWNLEKLREFLAILNNSYYAEATRIDIKKHFKRFLREQYKKDYRELFDDLRDLRITNEKSVNQEKINADTILQEGELGKLIRGAESLKLKALIILMAETAGRPSEILTAKFKSLKLDKGQMNIISTKNKTSRTLALNESIIHLRRYKQEYPYPKVQPEDFIFPSLDDRKKHMPIQFLQTKITKLSIATLGRKITPYFLRHTTLNFWQKHLTAKVYEKAADHSIQMASQYSHLNKQDIVDEMLSKVYHIEEVTKEEREEIKMFKEEIQKIVEAQDKKIKSLLKQAEIIKKAQG